MRIFPFFAVSLSLLSTCNGNDANRAGRFEDIRAAATSIIQRNEAPAVVVGVVEDNELVWAEGFGYADLEQRKPATPDTIFRLASISKSMTATGLMVLVDRGIVELDKPANDYLPVAKLHAYVGSANEMTVRRLANHTSGMPVHYNFFYPGSNPPEFDTTIRNFGFAYNRPGEYWEYSNLAYGVIDHIITKTSGTPWSKFMEREIYAPLSMSRTSDHVRERFQRDVAIQYTADVAGRFMAVPHYDFDHPGASAVLSSVNDLARFARMHLNDGELDGARILSKTAAQEMRRPTAHSPARGLDYGIAFSIGPFADQPSIGSAGGMPGVATTVRMFPQDRNAIIVLTNGESHSVTERLTQGVAQVLYASGHNSDEGEPQVSLPAPSVSEPTAEQAVKWIGHWDGFAVRDGKKIPLSLDIRSSNQASVSFNAQPPRSLSNLEITHQEISGSVTARFETANAYQGTSALIFRLRPSDNRIVGRLTASQPEHFALSHWVELDRGR